MCPQDKAHAKRGPIRAARADQVYRFLVYHGGDSLEMIRHDIPDMTRAELDRAIADLVAEDPPRAFIEVGATGYSIHVGPYLYDEPESAAAA